MVQQNFIIIIITFELNLKKQTYFRKTIVQFYSLILSSTTVLFLLMSWKINIFNV